MCPSYYLAVPAGSALHTAPPYCSVWSSITFFFDLSNDENFLEERRTRIQEFQSIFIASFGSFIFV